MVMKSRKEKVIRQHLLSHFFLNDRGGIIPEGSSHTSSNFNTHVARAIHAENKKGDNDTPAESDLAPYFNSGKFPTSVMGETYNINPCGQNPTATLPSRLKMAKRAIEAGGQVTLEEN
jgi:hypothetical protein